MMYVVTLTRCYSVEAANEGDAVKEALRREEYGGDPNYSNFIQVDELKAPRNTSTASPSLPEGK